jgi:hypothetical protein
MFVLAVFGWNRASAQTALDSAGPPVGNSPANLQSIDQRIEQLEAEVRELRNGSSTAQNATYSTDSTAKQDANTPSKSEYVVGSDLSVKSEFRNGLFLWFATPNNDFSLHIGGWVQLDNVWWDQADALKTPPGARPGHAQGVASGASAGGIGGLFDGVYFRRIRLSFEGTFWENGEYRLIPALENNQFATAGLDEFWVGGKDLPLVGSLRLGHIENALGLEGDMTTSSRCMTFMERSAYSESIELNQNFVTGLWLSDNYLDQRVTWEAAAFRPDASIICCHNSSA